YVQSIHPARLHPSTDAISTIDCEQDFRELCSKALGVTRFTDILMQCSVDPHALQAFAQRARGVVGYESASPLKECDLMDELLLAMASAYRIGLLDLAGEEKLRVLMVAEMMVRRTWSGLPQTPTSQGIVNTLVAQGPIHRLLACGDQPFKFGVMTNKSFSFQDAELTFAAFISTSL